MRALWRTAVVLAALIGAGQASAAEVIHSFVSDVKVAKNGEKNRVSRMTCRE